MSRTAKAVRRAEGRPEPIGGSAWLFVVGVFVASRLLFFLAGTLAIAFLPTAFPAGAPVRAFFPGYWGNWDGAWYLSIAMHGYGRYFPPSTAFFPLYPLLVRLGWMLGGDPAAWGVGISLVCALIATYFLYAVAEKFYGRGVARYTVLTFALFPTAFYLNAVYTESPFLALSIGCVWAAFVRRNFLLAGILGALAAATRNFGVLLVIPLFFEWWQDRQEIGFRGLLSISFVPMGLLAYLTFLWARFGNPLLFVTEQGAYWDRKLTDPVTVDVVAWKAAAHGVHYWFRPAALFVSRAPIPSFEASNATNLLFLIFLLVAVGIAGALLPPKLSIYTALMALLPALTPSGIVPPVPLMGVPRFALEAFPIFIVLGILFAGGRKDAPLPKVGAVVWLVLSAALGVVLAVLFVTGRWVA